MLILKGCLLVNVIVLLITNLEARVQTKAASTQVNCGCQCSNLTFRDKYGKVQGNCKSADQTGARWCYVNSWGSPCQDKRSSKRFSKPWSYEACATPPPHLCFGSGGGSCGYSGCSGGGGGGYGGGGGSLGNSCTCPRNTRLQPVCGRDGRTYQHPCACGCAGTTVQCQGACPCNTGGGYGSGGYGTGCTSSTCGSSSNCGSLAQILGTCGRRTIGYR